MLGLAVGVTPQYRGRVPVPFPDGFGWDSGRFGFDISQSGGRYQAEINPRDLVDPAIWTGAALHVDGSTGDDGNSGMGVQDGDFSDAKRTICATFVAGNATGAPYRVLVKAGIYEESAFTRNGNDEPTQAVAVIGWGGALQYRTGPFSVVWTDAGGTYSAPETSVRRVFRCDVQTPEGLHSELTRVADVAAWDRQVVAQPAD